MRSFLLFSVCVLLLGFHAKAGTLSGFFVPRAPLHDENLSGVGALDWLHSSLDATNSTRNGVVSPRITEIVPFGDTLPKVVTNSVGFSWNNGTPLFGATNVLTSLGASSLTNGFSVGVPIDTTVHKLKIYLGAFAARGQVEITLNETTLPFTASVDSITETNGFFFLDVVGDKNNDLLTANYTVAALHETNGYISLQAIGLTTNAHPSVSITSVTNEENILLNAATVLTAAPVDSDGTVTNVSFFVDEEKIGEATTAPFQCVWTGTNVGPHVITAVATDHNGAEGVSSSVNVIVTSNTGAMIPAVTVAPANVNLTTEGASDWVHWGIFTENSIDRKTGVVPQISDFSLVGSEPAYSYGDNATGYTWSDGTPNVSALGTITGVFVVGVSNGFEVTFPADASPRTAKLYVGTYGAKGKFTAALSDYSAPVFVDRSIVNVENGPASVYTLSYAAGSAEQTLTITFTVDEMYDLGFGNVTLQAATLVNTVEPLAISLTAPTNTSVFNAPGNIPLQASLSGGDGAQRTVEFYNGNTKLGQTTATPHHFNWNNVPPGDYAVVAKTTNSLGVVQSSAPIRMFVIATGGIVSGTFDTTSGSVNLSAEGTQDWVHWGSVRKNSVERKLGVVEQISDFEEIGSGRVDQYGDNLVSFNWSDGTPTLQVFGTTTGLFKNGEGNGFEITVPADRTLRRLKIYVGLYGARGAFEAVLSDLSAAPYLHSSFQNVFNNAAGVYTIEYSAASPGQTLALRYTSKILYDIDFGNVTLQAATLHSISPKVSSFDTTPSTAGFSFSTEIGWNYVVEFTDSLAPQNWQPLAGYPGTGGNITFNDATPPSQKRFYRIKMSR